MTERASRPSREVLVELVEGEYVVPYGKREVTWLIRENDGWIHVASVSGADVERCAAGTGTVWENRTRLRLSVGRRLLRVTSAPRAPTERSVLEHLSGRAGPQRRVTRAEYRVGARGELVPTGGRGA